MVQCKQQQGTYVCRDSGTVCISRGDKHAIICPIFGTTRIRNTTNTAFIDITTAATTTTTTTMCLIIMASGESFTGEQHSVHCCPEAGWKDKMPSVL
jgi:hypothetical protein